jgi:hypothetical protein
MLLRLENKDTLQMAEMAEMTENKYAIHEAARDGRSKTDARIVVANTLTPTLQLKQSSHSSV